jgi:hypothetical protein
MAKLPTPFADWTLFSRLEREANTSIVSLLPLAYLQ